MRLTFLDEYRIPNDLSFQSTLIGGLSGMDYNRKKDEYYLVSDDRSATNTARFYTAKLRIRDAGIDSIWFTGLAFLRTPLGKYFPKYADDSLHSCDPEDLRFNPKKNEWTWCSEGERFIGKGAVYLQDPSIYNMNADGMFRDSFMLPLNMHMRAAEEGPRRNSSIEGLAYANHYRVLYASLEEPLYEDGPQAATKDSGAWSRITRFDTRSLKAGAQYAYRLDPVSSEPAPRNAFKINGISAILAISKDKLVVVERSFSTGVKQNTIKLYLASLTDASNVAQVHSLISANFKPISKKLLLNLDSLGIYIDNIEGVCLGPTLSNGKQCLLLISDNNFRKEQVTQVLLFRIE